MSNFVQQSKYSIPQDTRNLISTRYHTVTQAINQEFWNFSSDTENSLYVGSYGRGTAIDTSDIDILITLPEEDYMHYDAIKGNGQSRLLQAVRQALLAKYPRSDIRADGQVVKIDFSDGMKFEILPAFKNINCGSWDDTYKYPDTNMGGHWKSTNPKTEQEAMRQKNNDTNGLLFDTCKHLRYIRDNYFTSYHLSGIVIDSFVYVAMGNWHWLSQGETGSSKSGDFENQLFNFFHQNYSYSSSLYAPGSKQLVLGESSFDCLEKVLKFLI